MSLKLHTEKKTSCQVYNCWWKQKQCRLNPSNLTVLLSCQNQNAFKWLAFNWHGAWVNCNTSENFIAWEIHKIIINVIVKLLKICKLQAISNQDAKMYIWASPDQCRKLFDLAEGTRRQLSISDRCIMQGREKWPQVSSSISWRKGSFYFTD